MGMLNNETRGSPRLEWCNLFVLIVARTLMLTYVYTGSEVFLFSGITIFISCGVEYYC